MALRTVTFEVTPTTSQGGSRVFGSDDANLPVNTLARPARLVGVQVDASEAVGSPTITIRELPVVDADEDSQDRVPGRALYSKQNVASPPFVDDDVSGSDETSDQVWIQTKYLRCEVDNALSGDVLSVKVFYESAGDQRF